MKKRSSSRVVNVFNSIINIRAWFDWERVRSSTLFLVNGVQRLFVPKKPLQAESFTEAKKQYDLTDTDLQAKQKALFRLSMVMLVVAGCILFYAGYQLFFGTFRAAIVSLVIMMIALVLAFRYHFWYFQIKNHKLGCTLEEWYRQGILGEKE